MSKNLLVIAGPTASGKTAVAVKIAQYFNCSVISADSRQFFHEMQIGTARPLEDELENVPHYFLADRSIKEEFTVADFEVEALRKIEELFLTNDWVIMTGGSGLFIDAVCNGIDEIPDIDESYRLQLMHEFESKGLEPLILELKERDPELFETIDLQNHRRVIRALEVCRATGKPFSELRKGKRVERPFNIIKTGLLWERDALYDRINKRVDKMLEQGLLAEAKALLPYKGLNALHTVGYTELFRHFAGELSFEEAVSLIKQNSRRYAKRQMTWFRKDKDYHWYEINEIPYLIAFVEKLGKDK